MRVFGTVCAGFLFLSGAVYGEDWHKNTVSAGIGAAIPTGNATNYLGTAPLVSVNYGRRFTKYLQADAGLEFAWGAANNVNIEQTDVGQIQGGDHEYMIPLGGRVIIPTPFHRMEVSAGGGGIYLHYSETVPSNAYYSFNCYTCTARGGWGGYALGNVRYYLDSNRIFHVGTTVRYISASVTGDPVGSAAAFKSTDHWVTVTFGAGVSF